MTYLPVVTTEQLGGDITTLAKTLLQQETEKEMRVVQEVSETSTASPAFTP